MNPTQLLELILLLSAFCSASITARSFFRRQQAKSRFLKIERRLID